MSNAQDLTKLSEKELQKELADARSELHHLKFQAGNAQLNNVRAIRMTRARIARILTEISARAKAVKQS